MEPTRPLWAFFAIAAAISLTVPTVLAVPPPNDDWSNPMVITAPMVFSQDLSEATVSPTDPPACYGGVTHTVWFKFTPVYGAGEVTFEATGSFLVALAVYRIGPFGSFDGIGCSRDYNAKVEFAVLPATSYYIMMGRASGEAANVVVTTTFAGSEINPDSDGDGVADFIEGEICGRPVTRNAVNSQGTTLGACPSSTNYVPPNTAITAEVPTWAEVGPDQDEDGIPGSVMITWTTVTVDPLSPSVVTWGVSRQQSGELDPDDDDAQNPLPTQELVDRLLDLVGEVHDLLDLDRDGVPDAAEPGLCEVENQNSPADGTCVGSDYTPPS